jgi:hypothetical protein
LLSKFIDADVADHLAAILRHTFDSIEQVYHVGLSHGGNANPGLSSIRGSPSSSSSSSSSCCRCSMPSLDRGASPDLNELAGPGTIEGDVPRIILQSCALGSRVVFRTLEQLNGLDNSANLTDMRALHRNLRFLSVRTWAGLPYIYAWLYVTSFCLGLSCRSLRG